MSFVYAYNCDYDNFIKHYNNDSHKIYTDACVCRGIVFSLDFCKKILLSNIEYSDFVYKVAYSKLIMNNIVDIEGCKKYKPFCIWYPQLPSVETCYKLIEIGGDILYSVAIVSILIGDSLLWNSCGNIKDSFLHDLAVRCNRPWVPSHTSTVINLKYERIETDPSPKPSVDLFFQFKADMNNNVFTYMDAVPYKYCYPLGLRSLYENGFEYHMININNLSYLYDKDGPNDDPDYGYW